MLIYILTKDCYGNYCDSEDVVCIVSTDIQKILDYLSLDKMSYNEMVDYEILIKPDGSKECGIINVNKEIDKNLIRYTPMLLLKNKDVLHELVEKTGVWCKNLNASLDKQERKRKEEAIRKQEEEERKLYERLKEKYEK